MKKITITVLGLFITLSTDLQASDRRSEVVISNQPKNSESALESQILQLLREGHNQRMNELENLADGLDAKCDECKACCCNCIVTSCLAGLAAGTAYYFEQKSK